MKQRKILLFYVLSLDHHMKILHLKLLIVNGNIRINMDFDVNFKIISFNYGFILNDFVIVDNGDENYFILLIHYKNLYILYFHICYLIECIFWTFFWYFEFIYIPFKLDQYSNAVLWIFLLSHTCTDNYILSV